jgi:hypothetical protein
MKRFRKPPAVKVDVPESLKTLLTDSLCVALRLARGGLSSDQYLLEQSVATSRIAKEIERLKRGKTLAEIFARRTWSRGWRCHVTVAHERPSFLLI